MGKKVGAMMPRVVKPLTDLEVKQLPNGLHSVGGIQGLKLQVTSKNARSWILRAKVLGKVRDMGLGSYPMISLRTAREIASNHWELIKKGLDPIYEKQKVITQHAAARASQQTFAQCTEIFIKNMLEKLVGNKSLDQWKSTLETYAFPVIGRLPMTEITKVHVISILEPIWDSKHETASRLRGRIERIIDYARAKGLRTGDNPAVYKGNLDSALPSLNKRTQRHHPSLPYTLAPSFIQDLNESVSGLAGKALYFTILTAARSGEVRGATWDEIDLLQKQWTIPAERMKTRREHVIPLTDKCIELLEELKNSDSGLIFKTPRNKQLSDAALAKVIKDMHAREIRGGRRGWTDPDADDRIATPHGFRSTFRVWAAEQTDFASEIAEHALAHRLKDGVEAAYQRKSAFPKRVMLMDAWSNFLHQK